MKSSSDIAVADFRQILIWPLLLFRVDQDGNKQRHLDGNQINEITQQFKAHDCGTWTWRGEHAPIVPLEKPIYESEQAYSEVVYFHSFVRDFLYGGDGTKAEDRPVRLFTRNDVESYEVTLKSNVKYSHAVERVEFYLFESGIGILVVELATPTRADGQPLKLAEVLDLQNVVRMAFPRRWNDKGVPSEAPLHTALIGTTIMDGKPAILAEQDYKFKNDFTEVVRKRAELPAAKPWQFLLQPLMLYGDEKTKSSYCFQQIEDQRIPSMAYLAIDDPRDISDWDFARLAFLDGAGESSVGSYSDSFLKDWEEKNAYDRFWQREPSQEPANATDEIKHLVKDHNATMRTRWLCSGYGLTVVGSKADPFYTRQIKANFHHHYFRMGMIAHFHRASILMLRDALADATKELDAEKKLERITKVQEQMVEFRSRYWFREVSTQLQGQEIFRWWSDRLKNQELFDHVSLDIDAAAAFVRTKQEGQLSQVATIATTFGLGLSLVSLIVSCLGLNFILAGEVDSSWKWSITKDVLWKTASIVFFLFAVAYLLGWWLFREGKWPWLVLRRLIMFIDLKQHTHKKERE